MITRSISALILSVHNDMASHMKTTIHIPDSIFYELRELAHQESRTMKSLVEEGLRFIVSMRRQRRSFHLRKATFKGDGLQSHLAGATWDQIREQSYEGRGG
jgi:hypothetical protein